MVIGLCLCICEDNVFILQCLLLGKANGLWQSFFDLHGFHMDLCNHYEIVWQSLIVTVQTVPFIAGMKYRHSRDIVSFVYVDMKRKFILCLSKRIFSTGVLDWFCSMVTGMSKTVCPRTLLCFLLERIWVKVESVHVQRGMVTTRDMYAVVMFRNDIQVNILVKDG